MVPIGRFRSDCHVGEARREIKLSAPVIASGAKQSRRWSGLPRRSAPRNDGEVALCTPAMRYFLDTEFNGFAGELISLALVPEHGDEEYYAVLHLPEDVHGWVRRNVVPYLHSVPEGLHRGAVSRGEAASELARYLAADRDPVIVADWPEDISHFCMLLVTGPGEIAPIGSMRFEFVASPGFSTAMNSKVPHNALHDARALRDFVLQWVD